MCIFVVHVVLAYGSSTIDCVNVGLSNFGVPVPKDRGNQIERSNVGVGCFVGGGCNC